MGGVVLIIDVSLIFILMIAWGSLFFVLDIINNGNCEGDSFLHYIGMILIIFGFFALIIDCFISGTVFIVEYSTLNINLSIGNISWWTT
jgi:hypothetical protein